MRHLDTSRTEIVVPTLAEAHRGPQLMRAIKSIHQDGGQALVIVNGSRFSPELKDELHLLPNTRVISISEPGLPNAIHIGRKAVESDYFGFLDDDDYLLPGSISLRESFLDGNPKTDVVIANGLREEWGNKPQLFASRDALEVIRRDPLSALLRANWMTPCGALYRDATVSSDVFHQLTKYAEWTDVASRLIDNFTFDLLFENTFVQSDTPGSLSKHTSQATHILNLHEKMELKVKTAAQRSLWNDRISSLHHQIAQDELAANRRPQAWHHHLRSLLHAPMIGIPRYLAYTRKFAYWREDSQ